LTLEGGFAEGGAGKLFLLDEEGFGLFGGLDCFFGFERLNTLSLFGLYGTFGRLETFFLCLNPGFISNISLLFRYNPRLLSLIPLPISLFNLFPSLNFFLLKSTYFLRSLLRQLLLPPTPLLSSHLLHLTSLPLILTQIDTLTFFLTPLFR